MMYETHHIDCLFFETEPVSLLYCDPPYSCISEDSYYGTGGDLEAYLNYMRSRFWKFEKFLLPDSNLLVHVDYKAVHYLKVELDKIFGRENFRNEIIWCFSNPSVVKRHLPRKHNTILWYGFGNYPFNAPRVPYKTKMNVGGKTAWSKEKKDWEEYKKKGKLLEDWWADIPALCRNEVEKTGYPTQKPIQLLRRIVETFSNKGDRVLDTFMGSGTLLEAALSLDRVAIGCDLSFEAVELTKKRLNDYLAGDVLR